MIAVIVITHLWNTDFQQWWYTYFDPHHAAWYTGEVWGNVWAVIPLGILGTIGYWAHRYLTKDIKKFDAKAAHEAHMKKLQAIVDALDPEAESSSQLDVIADRVNEQTPGGLQVLLEEIRALQATRGNAGAPEA